ncbi:conserved virulence factor C family protein [Bacillus taeanensis]|uniref:Virulence factor n=1 Tax=Bacillus taeanensis TaxID=273032 RepID=A0A366Y3D2_9BACI|nr:virulence factor [Bacillus taeanensis]RBW70913.1 virulence factor [Bacillus taeanensis]
MKIISIEPTPSPNSMKVILNESLPPRETRNFKQEQKHEAPEYAQRLLAVEGVKGFYHVADFIALERNPKVDWQVILPKVRQAFGEKLEENTTSNVKMGDDHFGEVKVMIQMFRGIPMQVKLANGNDEQRFGLPERFKESAMKAQSSSNNLVMERQWKEQSVRYGDMNQIGEEVVEEINAAYDEKRLEELVEAAFQNKHEQVKERISYISSEEAAKAMKSEDWKVRFAALEKLNPTEEDLPLLAEALADEKISIRRLAAVYLGMIESEKVLPYLYKALKDKAVTVRRTAGDCLSDIGSTKAIPAMVEALKDKNKLVRWRAAMFLYEVGDETALEALRKAQDDSEFEVSLQVKMAIERIESGEEAAGSVWQQMTNARKQND